MDFGNSFNDRQQIQTEKAAQIEAFNLDELVLPFPDVALDAQEVRKNIEDKILSIAAHATNRSSDSYSSLPGRPHEMNQEHSSKVKQHRENEFYLIDLNLDNDKSCTATPFILQCEVITHNGRIIPIVRPYADINGKISPQAQKICSAIFQEFGLTPESLKSLIDHHYLLSIPNTTEQSALTPFSWSAKDTLLAIVAHLPFLSVIHSVTQLVQSQPGEGAGWIFAILASGVIAGVCSFGFWDNISYLRNRSRIASMMHHLTKIEDRAELIPAVQGTLDHETISILERYVGDKKSTSDSVTLAHAITRIGIAELSKPRKIQYYSYDTEQRKDVLHYDNIDSNRIFRWLSKVGGADASSQAQEAVFKARADFEKFLAGRKN